MTKKSETKFYCDICSVARVYESYRRPDDWVQIEISVPDSKNHEIHFCKSCWTARRPEHISKLPEFIQGVFDWGKGLLK